MAWRSIEHTRLIYADAGAVSQKETARIVRFVERFRDHDWVTARKVIHWWSAKSKPKAETAREFMKHVVDLGFAIDNGKTGKDYAIRIQEIAGNSSNDSLKHPSQVSLSQVTESSNSLVTTASPNPEMPAEHAFRASNNLSAPFDDVGVTTEQHSPNGSNNQLNGGSSVTLLPGVSNSVTTPKVASGKASEDVCYPVTGTGIQVGDCVVLTAQGASRTPDELKAIWSVKTIHDQNAIVHNDAVGNRKFPLEWLAFYSK